MNKSRKVLWLVLILLFICFSINPVMRVVYPLRYGDIIESNADKYDLDKFMVMGIIKAESNYIHDARSHVAYGLMQVTEDTAFDIANKLKIDITVSDLDNPEINIEMGCCYLNFLYKYYGNMDVALAAYNGGMGNVNKWLNDEMYSKDQENLHDIPFPETKKYVKKVNRYTEIYRRLYGRQ